ncbi:MAG: hypothetical protein EON55_01460 [Alphaproteobacteria bacterium]|nr:MAG: hypothetical protein EON55_01460 [Alphaproteobacteria bacterium]
MTGTKPLTDIEYKVRAISQHGMVDVPGPVGNYACWYAASAMVLAYRRPLGILEMNNLRTLARRAINRGIQPRHLGQLAIELGLEQTPAQHLFPRIIPEEWHSALSTLGPLMVVIYQHMVVVRGLRQRNDEWEIVYNDPFTGCTMSKPTWRFASEVDWTMPMLYLRSAHRPPLLAAS